MKSLTPNNSQEIFYLESFLEMLAAERSASKNTIISYQNDLSDLLNFFKNRGYSIISVKPSGISEYTTELGKRELATKSLARKISAIRQFFAFLVTDSIRQDNPAINLELPKREQSLPKALSVEQIDALMDTAYNDNSPEGIRTAAMLEILYSSGMRVSELIDLKLQSIQKNVSNRESLMALIIKGKGDKERMVMLNENAVETLNKYLEVRSKFLKPGVKSDWLFPSFTKDGKVTTLTRQRFHQILKEIASKAGVDPSLVSPHKIRHSFASHMLQNGANLRVVQELLGHSDISSTQIYTKVLSEKAKELVFEKHPLANQ